MRNLKILKQKVLITGANGLLGQKLVQAFHEEYEILGIGRRAKPVLTLSNYHYRSCDITRRKQLHDLVFEFKPDVIINAAAYTNVDGCEEDKENCWRINVIGVENLAHTARGVEAFLVHISTDYIFDGKSGNYSEESLPNPLGYYGRSKLASENAVLISGAEYAIIRTMILYGVAEQVRPNFVTWLIDKLSRGESVTIVDDQLGHPTLADDLALAIRRIVQLKKTGVFHIAGSDCIDRYHFALKVADIFGLDKNLIKPVKTEELHQKAPRPLNSSFNMEKARKELGIQLKGVEEGLRTLKKQMETRK